MKYNKDGKAIPENIYEKQMLYLESLRYWSKVIDEMTSDINERIKLKSLLFKK